MEPENERVGRSYDLRENRRQVSLFEARPIGITMQLNISILNIYQYQQYFLLAH